ncbi:hypothetical protein SAMN05192529_11040 [Arachidicoccus rhizosphaerae]|uniref:Uncharacterized protein n=1 Tax=Arachidicoccus rhizosphaerae TaxID=551991 RepID=A0A1H3Z5L5_9BACT|nr:hypothetical protein SAMN05192529_11040 [Arachidicoccus rhizosphaerae]
MLVLFNKNNKLFNFETPPERRWFLPMNQKMKYNGGVLFLRQLPLVAVFNECLKMTEWSP